jgi:nucleotide-binding universal stress UspA family protein
VPVDFSQASFQALQYAIHFAERVVARLILLHVVDCGDALTADGYAMYDLSAIQENLRKNAEEQMRKFVGLAKFRRVPFDTVISVAPAVSEICAVAEGSEIDLIITATHGRSGFKHLLMGSVAESVVRYAKRPVLVVLSHAEVRAGHLTKATGHKGRAQTTRADKKPVSPCSSTKRNRKLLAHPAPERRKTNRYRESHVAVATS